MLLSKPEYDSPEVPFVEAQHKGGSQTPTLVVIHSTVSASTAGTALAIANMWHRSTSPITSAHYSVDSETVIQSVYDHVVAYHCGYNTGSLGIEMCDNPSDGAKRWSDGPHGGVLQRTAELVGDLCLAHNIPVRFLTDAQLATWGRTKKASDGGISTHAQMSRVFKKSSHWDPGEWPSASFLSAVKLHVEERKKPVPKKNVALFKITTLNIMSFPTILRGGKFRAVIRTAFTDQLIGTQECDEDSYKRKLLKKWPHALGIGKLNKLNSDEYSCALIPDPRTFDVLGSGSEKVYGGHPQISKDRHLTFARLLHKASGIKMGAIVYHGPVVKAQDRALRLSLRQDTKEVVQKKVREFMAKGLPVAVLSDSNDRANWFGDRFEGRKVTRVGTGIDQIILIDGPDHKWEVVKHTSVDQPSDHNTLTAKVKLIEK